MYALVSSGLLFCSYVIELLLYFLLATDVSALFHSAHLFLVEGEFQAWDWLCMVSTNLRPQRRNRVRHGAWSRNLDSNFFSCRGLNLGPLIWQSITQPLDHRRPRNHVYIGANIFLNIHVTMIIFGRSVSMTQFRGFKISEILALNLGPLSYN